jgi:hypothetical protein
MTKTPQQIKNEVKKEKNKVKELLTQKCGYAFPPEYLDEVIVRALRKRMNVTLFLCKDEEGGFGFKINGKVICRNMAWECFEYKLEDLQ